jgi:hypothetical protein
MESENLARGNPPHESAGGAFGISCRTPWELAQRSGGPWPPIRGQIQCISLATPISNYETDTAKLSPPDAEIDVLLWRSHGREGLDAVLKVGFDAKMRPRRSALVLRKLRIAPLKTFRP